MPMIEIAFTQHSGKQHRAQQDAMWNGEHCLQDANLPTASLTLKDDRFLVAIADGVAVSPSPHLASRFVIEALAGTGMDALLSARRVRDIQGQLCDRYAKGRTFGSSTTLVAVHSINGSCQVINAGDSRSYLISAEGKWRQTSHDHTILNDMIASGEAEAGKEYARMYNGLAHCLIADDEEDQFAIHCSQHTFTQGDSLLLCSDGLHDTLGDARIQQLYCPDLPPNKQVEIWRRAVLATGAPDNFSIILARHRLSARKKDKGNNNDQ